MANGDEAGQEVRDTENLEVHSASWLRNADVHQLDDRVISWTKFDLPDIPEQPGDRTFVLDKQMRPELLARKFYGEQRLWWIIAIANDIREPLTQLHEGRRVRIPDPERVRERIQAEGKL